MYKIKSYSSSLIPGSVFLLLAILLWLLPKSHSYAPDITLPLLNGEQVSLNALQGKPVLVTFWATTCAGCKKEIPHLIELYEEFSSKGFEIIAIAMSYDPPNQILSFSKHRNIPYSVAMDISGEAAHAFGNVEVTPTSFLIAPDGNIVHYKVGIMDMKELRKKVTGMLS